MEGAADLRNAPNAALHAAFGAAQHLVAADANYAGQLALAGLKVLQLGTTGMCTHAVLTHSHRTYRLLSPLSLHLGSIRMPRLVAVVLFACLQSITMP